MQRLGISAGLCAIFFVLTGCGKDTWSASGKSRGGLAVVDLTAVAKRLGRADEIDSAVKARTEVLNKKLQDTVAVLRKQLEDQQLANDDPPTDDQKKELAILQNQIQNKAAQSQQTLKFELEKYKNELFTSFRDDVKGVAQKVAAERGLGTVITKSEVIVLSVDADSEITDAVIDKMRGNLAPMIAAANPAPKPKAETADEPAAPAPKPKAKKAKPAVTSGRDE